MYVCEFVSNLDQVFREKVSHFIESQKIKFKIIMGVDSLMALNVGRNSD